MLDIHRWLPSKTFYLRFSFEIIVEYWTGHKFPVLNPFPNKPWFLRVCSTSLLKTLWEQEKLLVTSNLIFPFAVVFSTLSENYLPFSLNMKLSSAKAFTLEASTICLLEKGEVAKDELHWFRDDTISELLSNQLTHYILRRQHFFLSTLTTCFSNSGLSVRVCSRCAFSVCRTWVHELYLIITFNSVFFSISCSGMWFSLSRRYQPITRLGFALRIWQDFRSVTAWINDYFETNSFFFDPLPHNATFWRTKDI